MLVTARCMLSAESLPSAVGELRADDLNHLAGAGCALLEAGRQRTAEGMAVKESAGKEIAGSRGVDHVRHRSRRSVNTLFSFDGKSTARSTFDHCDLTSLRQYSSGFFTDLAGHGARLIFVGKHNIYLGKQGLKKRMLALHDVPRGQVQTNFCATLVRKFDRTFDQLMVLHQIALNKYVVHVVGNHLLEVFRLKKRCRSEISGEGAPSPSEMKVLATPVGRVWSRRGIKWMPRFRDSAS